MHSALSSAVPDLGERSCGRDDIVERGEAELGQAVDPRTLALGLEDRLGDALQQPRPRRARRDREDDGPLLEVPAPVAGPVEVEIAADLALEDLRAFRRAIDLDEGF